MKKLFLTIILLFSASLFAEEFTGIYEIKFGDSFEKVNEVMEQKGCMYLEGLTPPNYFSIYILYYAGLLVDQFEYDFYEDKLFSLKINFNSKVTENDILNTMELMIEKFNFIQTGTKMVADKKLIYYSSDNILLEVDTGRFKTFSFTDYAAQTRLLDEQKDKLKEVFESSL